MQIVEALQKDKMIMYLPIPAENLRQDLERKDSESVGHLDYRQNSCVKIWISVTYV